MSTKIEQVLNVQSAWNQAPNDEPVFVVRAEDWSIIMRAALSGDPSTPWRKMLFDHAIEMRAYDKDNDIPF